MNEMKKPIELTKREQEEVAKLFAEFASREWETAQSQPQGERSAEDEDITESPVATKRKLTKKALLAICAAGIACILLICLCVKLFVPSPEQPAAYVTFSAGNHLVAAVTKDGKVLTPSVASSLGGYVLTTQTTDVLNWTDIVSISVGTLHTLGLKSNGTVVSTGFYEPDKYISVIFKELGKTDLGQTKVDGWTGITAIAAGYRHSVGLREDGTVVAVGDNSSRQCEVDDWTDIIQIAAGTSHTVGLKSDGTVVSTQIPPSQPDDGQCNVDTWTDIVYISAGSETTIGVRKDGTVVAAGANALGQCNVATWTDIVAVAAGIYHTVGVKKDGTVVCTEIIYNPLSSSIADYGQGSVERWEDIVAVAVTNQQTFGLKKDGTIVYAGMNTAEMNETKQWNNIRLP